MLRGLAVALRKWDSAKDRRRVLARFGEWRTLQQSLAAPRPSASRLLIVRLDDIGDYLLFRNQLGSYRQSERWQDHRITLLGNASWRTLFEHLDRDAVDEVIWVEKNRYLQDAAYRWDVWSALRERGFGAAIAASRTRPLLLDDLCVLAAAPEKRIGCLNNYRHADWNRLSDALYSRLFDARDPLLHEFEFNARFSAWACGIHAGLERPRIEPFADPPRRDPYLLCFVGANTRSKRWPAKRWIDFIERHRRTYASEVIVAGAGRAEVEMARLIQSSTGVRSIAGEADLWEVAAWVAGAEAVISNDTMGAHLGVSFERPTVIVANGVNHTRFTEYARAGIAGVETVYPEVFERRRRRVGDHAYDYTDAVSADIASIDAGRVLRALERLLHAGGHSGTGQSAA